MRSEDDGSRWLIVVMVISSTWRVRIEVWGSRLAHRQSALSSEP